MAVPKYNEFFPSFLQCLADGDIHTIQEIRTYCAKAFKLSEDDLLLRLPSGQNLFNNRVAWAQTYLKKAGLIESPKRSSLVLTETGKEAVRNGSENVDLSYLFNSPSFSEFYNNSKRKSHGSKKNSTEVTDEKSKTPQETISDALSELNSSLADDLMDEVMKLPSYEFERLIINLLLKMGYGSSLYGSAITTKKSGDEGIDGIITSDKFGFNTIYTQAKQWKRDSSVSRPDIQKFVGAVIGQGGNKGLFITTARFSKEARTFAEKQLSCKIVLIDGEELADLMIEHNLGVSTIATYEVKRVDYDFFNDSI